MGRVKTEKDIIIQLLMHKLGIVRFEWTAELDAHFPRQQVETHYNGATMTHVVELVPDRQAEGER